MNQVVIIGGGPVGLALAVALSRYRVRSVVVEQRMQPTPETESRAIVWMPKGIEFLEWLGVLDEFTRHAVVRNVHRFRVHGRRLLDLKLGCARSRYGYSLNLPQYFTETLFETEAKKVPHLVKVKRGYTLKSLVDDGASVTVTVEEGATKHEEEIRAAFAVGCDGAKSRTRELLGIPLQWIDYGTFSAVADIETHLPDDPALSWIELNPRRPTGLFNFHPNKWRIVYRVNANETREQAVAPEFVAEIVRQHFPFVGRYNLLWASCFRLGQGQSERYFKGRVILAGDAAHPMGPSAGAGMMVGMLGVWRLAFRVRNILAEKAPNIVESVLNGYQADQQRGSRTLQKANAITFRQISLESVPLGVLRNIVLRIVSWFSFITKRMVVTDTLTDQDVHFDDYPR